MSRAVRCTSSGCSSLRTTVSVLFVMLAMLLLVAPIFGQTANGRISGTVKDQTGGAIVGAAVTVTDVARGLPRNLTTDEGGAYLATNLIPGNYSVRATFTGFQAWERTNIVLGVGGDLFIDVVLVPGAQTQTVTITEELPLVNTTSATLGGTLSNETINDLPVSGRNYVNIMDLRPGVVLQLGNNSGGAGAASVNGLRGEQSLEYLVEGLHAMDAYTGQSVMNNFALNGDATGILSTDAIQDFNQQFGNKAEYGYRPGGSTNIGLKSGTNAIHATGFAYFRKTELDARKYFNGPDTGQPLVNNSLEQFGGTVGGPIKRDKLFFFLSYEQQNSGHGSSNTATIPFTDSAMIENFPACLNNGPGGLHTCTPKAGAVNGGRAFTSEQHLILSCLAVRDQQGTVPAGSTSGSSVLLSPQSLSMVSLSSSCTPLSTYPNNLNGIAWYMPHGGFDLGAPANLDFAVSTVWPNLQTENRQISGMAKVDYTVNDKHSINGFYFRGNGQNRDQGSQRPIFRTNIIVNPVVLAGTWTWLPNSAWANSFRVGFARSNQLFLPIDEETQLTQADIGLPTGVRTYGARNFGYTQSFQTNGFSSIGSRNTEVQGPEDSFEIQEQVSYLAGKHSVRFGGSLMTAYQNGATWANTRGTFGFGGGGSGASNGLVALFSGQKPVPTAIDPDGAGAATAVTLNTNTNTGQNTGLQTSSLFFGDPTSNVRRITYSMFLQDDWRIHPRLTLNLGMRYDVSSVPYDKRHILGGFRPELGIVQEEVQVHRVHSRDSNNFGPRLGFAWDIFGTGKTVLRGGGGLTYELPTLRHYVETGNAFGPTGLPTAWAIGCNGTLNSTDLDLVAPGTQSIAANQLTNCSGTLTTSGGTRDVGQANWSATNLTILPSINWDAASTGRVIFPAGNINNCATNIVVASNLSSSAQTGRAGARCSTSSLDPQMPTPYVEDWRLSIQHAIVNNVVLDVAYVGNHGVKLIGRTDDNQMAPFQMWNTPSATPGQTFAQRCVALPTQTNCGGGAFSSIPTTTGQVFNSKFPHLNTIVRIWGRDTSNYNGLQATLTARNFHGLNLTAGYTWSQALAIASGNGGGVPTDSYFAAYDYGAASSDLRHKFSLSPVYNFPSVQGFGGLLDGWRINGIFRYQSGRPFGPGNFGGDTLGDGRGSRPDFFGDRSDFEFWSPDEEPALFHPGGPATGTATCSLNNSATSTCVGTGNANRTLASLGDSIFESLGGNINSPNGCGTAGLPAGACYTAADLAINTTACTAHATTPTHAARLRAYGCWTRGNSVILPADLHTLGNIPRSAWQGNNYWNLDASITKRQRITERLSSEFRFEFFNILNHPTFANKGAGLGCTVTTCNLGFRSTNIADTGNVIGSGGPRRLQLGVKLFW